MKRSISKYSNNTTSDTDNDSNSVASDNDSNSVASDSASVLSELQLGQPFLHLYTNPMNFSLLHSSLTSLSAQTVPPLTSEMDSGYEADDESEQMNNTHTQNDSPSTNHTTNVNTPDNPPTRSLTPGFNNRQRAEQDSGHSAEAAEEVHDGGTVRRGVRRRLSFNGAGTDK